VLHGGVGKAARPVVATGGTKGRLGVHHGQQIRADKALPEIAALIDKDQFELISHPESGIVVIQGGAGSGKTTVALHRVAYLNFADGRRFRPNAMLFVVPSAALVRYVSGVLPALGRLRRPGHDLHLVGPHHAHEGAARRADQVQRRSARAGVAGEEAPAVPDRPGRAGRRADRDRDRRAGRRAGVGDQVLGEWTRLAKRALVPRLWGMLTWVRKAEHLDPAVRIACEGLLKRWRKRADDVVTDWAELLTDPVALARGFAGCDDVSAKDLERVVAWVKRQIAAPAKPVVDDDGVAVVAADGSTLGVDDDDPAGRVDDEDDPLWLRLVQLKRGGLFTPDGDQLQYSHVAIDEAQDRSAIEVKVLVDAVHAPEGRVDHRSVTIAGDTAQRLVFDNNFSGWADLLMQTGQPAIVRPLKLSYRSTAEVMLLAREVLGPELAPDEALAARPGEPVELHEFSDIGEAVAFLSDALRNLMAREPTASCCVIARHPEQADAYFSGLARAEIPALRRVKRDEFSFQPGIDVTDVTQVKGLEFDYVVMIEVNAQSYPAVNWARHLLHIGVTRAAHQLWLVSTTEPSPLIPAALRDGGRMTVG
jgi:DNA helicase-2/ATP-dependent DNA helicase PcrA